MALPTVLLACETVSSRLRLRTSGLAFVVLAAGEILAFGTSPTGFNLESLPRWRTSQASAMENFLWAL